MQSTTHKITPGTRFGATVMKKNQRLVLLATAAVLPGVSHAQLVISDTLTGASSSYNWQALNGATMTAGDGSGTIPACVGLGAAYLAARRWWAAPAAGCRIPRVRGRYALTNGDTTTGTNGNNQTGAVVSNFTFPTNQGLRSRSPR